MGLNIDSVGLIRNPLIEIDEQYKKTKKFFSRIISITLIFILIEMVILIIATSIDLHQIIISARTENRLIYR